MLRMYLTVTKTGARGDLKGMGTFYTTLQLAVCSVTLFSSKNFWKRDEVVFLFLCDKYCPIID